IIFARRYGASNTFEKVNYPIGFNGRSGATPLGNLVDDFMVKQSNTKAVPFDWNNPDHAGNPFNRRDPRILATVLKNGDKLSIDGVRPNNPAIEIWAGGADGKDLPGTSKTGYYLNKYIDPTRNLPQGQSSIHTWILFRYGEILLNYAEAANEAYGPMQSYPGAGRTPNEAISDIRKRAAMPEFRTAATRITDQNEMRELIRLERRVELAFEDHRLWDVRRWMIAPETLGVPARGIEAVKNEDGTITYSSFVVENRVWNDRMYFYPVPLKELKITDGWGQNPLW
ncbi:MAG: RagB/SusD family nutrient uptake outer membrane protein, partial [Dysgonamonadaceae bacterium]|nr:RagB/SusD family nutrient uptake outer membrane protein [Dysgonamonadaceae bacterium]